MATVYAATIKVAKAMKASVRGSGLRHAVMAIQFVRFRLRYGL
jgi:hypothetical protein